MVLKLLYYKNGFKTFILTIADIKGIKGIEYVLVA